VQNYHGKPLNRSIGHRENRFHAVHRVKRPFHLPLVLILLVFLPVMTAACGQTTGTVSDASPSVAMEQAKEISDSAPLEQKRSGTKFPDFSMRDLDGNVVDQTLFASHDLTLINIWGTFCPPCIDEMPDLGKLAKVMESDYQAQLVGLVVDISDAETLALAKEILSQSNADHLNLMPDQAVSEFLSQFEYVPTSLFVDKDGYVVGQPIVGGHSYGDYLVLVKDMLGK